MTDGFRDYAMGHERMTREGVKRTPRIINSSIEGAAATQKAVRQQSVARSHNTFRPDIYRVSEGYLN